MAKKLLFTLFICFLSLFSNNLFANTPLNGENGCNTPPPDSIRVTTIANDFITLSWLPMQAGADHYLSVFEENAGGGWDSLYTVFVENTTSHTFTNFPNSKKHLIKVRTACENGGPSSECAYFFPPLGTIVELVLNGRDPGPVDKLLNCSDLFYPTNETDWIGFVIKKSNPHGSANLSYFEFSNNGGFPDNECLIKRVETNNSIVAANENNFWPTLSFDNFETNWLGFKFGEVEGGSFKPKGKIDLILSTNKVQLCLDPNFPLAPNFTFTPLSGTSASNSPRGDTHSYQLSLESSFERTTITNPFMDYINVLSPEPLGLCDISVIDLNGKTVYHEAVDFLEKEMVFPQNKLLPGLYFVRISNGELQKTFKIIKCVK